MLKREEVLDMAVHALAPLMIKYQSADASDLFDESLDIARRLVKKVNDVSLENADIDRDELLDMCVHALSALLKGREFEVLDELLIECVEVAQALMIGADIVIKEREDLEREELLDLAVHAQTAFIVGRPMMDAQELCNQSIDVAIQMMDAVDSIHG